jgi:hypothetical protein
MGGQGQLDGSMCLIIDRVENSAIQALDGLEQVGRELLQLVSFNKKQIFFSSY